MKKRKPDQAERVARKLVTIDGSTLRIAGWVFREKVLATTTATRRWFLNDLAPALRKAGVKGR